MTSELWRTLNVPGLGYSFVGCQPHAASRSRMCLGTGAVTVTAGLFLEIGTVTSRE